MKPHPALQQILAAADAGHDVAAIAAAHDTSVSKVYALLREYRPGRARKPRRRSSQKRAMILGLAAKGHEADRVAFLAQCSKAWVYRVLNGQ